MLSGFNMCYGGLTALFGIIEKNEFNKIYDLIIVCMIVFVYHFAETNVKKRNIIIPEIYFGTVRQKLNILYGYYKYTLFNIIYFTFLSGNPLLTYFPFSLYIVILLIYVGFINYFQSEYYKLECIYSK
jgi:hypothetical protein